MGRAQQGLAESRSSSAQTRFRQALLPLAVATLALAAPALARATGPPPLPSQLPSKPRLPKAEATRIFLSDDKVADWLARYPRKGRTVDTSYKAGSWTVSVWWGAAGEIATGRVDDRSGAVLEAWTGPQVAWKMARGYKGAFGGKEINNLGLWLAFCALFFVGLADLRRLLSVRNVDLLVLLSFTVSLWFFNRGDIFTSVPLAYPPLLYLLGRMVWSAWRGRTATFRSRGIGSHAGRPMPRARSVRGSRRTGAASRRTRKATRTARSPTRPTSRGT
jgi:hypothetical protein